MRNQADTFTEEGRTDHERSRNVPAPCKTENPLTALLGPSGVESLKRVCEMFGGMTVRIGNKEVRYRWDEEANRVRIVTEGER